MVGIIVIGVVATVIAATVFAVIPWSQDAAAKQSLGAVQTAQSVARAMTGSYLSVAELVSAGYLPAAAETTAAGTFGVGRGASVTAAIRTPLAVPDSGTAPQTSAVRVMLGGASGCYVAVADSPTGATFYVTSRGPAAERLTPTTDLGWCTSDVGGAPAAAVPPLTNDQCNGTDNVGGMAVECDVNVVNTVNLYTGASSSTVTTRACHGAANTVLPCTVSTVTQPALTTSVAQCNGSGNGGGGTATCTVSIVNNIVGVATAGPASANQCVGSGAGGGSEPTIACDPLAADSLATVVQCNGSGNGGGGTERVRCTVGLSPETSVLPVRIDQCNGSGNGGGSYVSCRATVTNVVTS